MKLNYEELLDYQKFWQESKELSQQRKDGLISLSTKFMQRVKDNGDEMDKVTLLYPEDCSDFSAFSDFADVMKAIVTVRDDGKKGAKIVGWFLHREIDVE